jgi:hypothetical protein
VWKASDEVLASARSGMVAAQDFELMEDNVPALRVFDWMSTQWRYRGMDGERCGLDYGVLPMAMRSCEIPVPARPSLIEDVRTMEFATLRFYSERAKESQQ